MKHSVALSLLIFVLNFSAKAQVDSSLVPLLTKIDAVAAKVKTFADSAGRDVQLSGDNGLQLSTGSYKRYVDNYFTYLAYDRGALPTGNLASLDLTDNNTQLTLALSKKFGSDYNLKQLVIATAGVKAKAENGITQLFNGNDPGAGTTFFADFAFLPGTAKVKYVLSEFENGVKITSPFDLLNQQRESYHQAFATKYTTEFQTRYKSLVYLLSRITNRLNDAALTDNERMELYKQKEEVEKNLKDIGILDKSAKQIYKGLTTEYADKLYELETNTDPWLWVKFFWLSGGVTYNRQSYDVYNEKNVLAKRFDTKTYDGWGFKLTANWFKEFLNEPSFFGSRYFNISYEPKGIHTFSAIKAQDVLRNITRSSSQDTVYLFPTSKKAKNITGKDYATGWQHGFSTTYTGMFGKRQSLGLNVKFEDIVADFSMPTYTTHLGVILRLLNSKFDPSDKKSKARVNFELFLELPDLADAGENGTSTWARRIIGINTTLPFSNIFFK